MSKYDIGMKYNSIYKLTFSELCEEIMDECDETNANDVPDEDSIRHKFKNHDKSGIIDKLNSHLSFDIEKIMEMSPKEKFEGLKLLKMLYYIEKEEDKVRFIDILSKPRLDNIPTETASKSKYGDVFSEIFNAVQSEISNANERYKLIEYINNYWEYLIDELMEYVISDAALKNPAMAAYELDRINTYLNGKILQRMSNLKHDDCSYEEGVMNTFYNILCCHRMMCNDVDRININYRICMSPPPESEYVNCFKKNEHYVITEELISCIKRILDFGNEAEVDDGARLALYLISYGKGVSTEERKYYNFALKHFNTAVNWMNKHTIVDNSDGVFFTEFVCIMQEIIHVQKNDERFCNDYYGNKYTNKPLLVAIKKPQNADAVIIQAWVKKIQNRFAVNSGAYELITLKREVENAIYEIKSEIYKFQNINDIEFVNDVICNFTIWSIISRNLAERIGTNFTGEIGKHIIKGLYLQVILDNEGVNVYNMFREFLLDKTAVGDLVAADIARQINEFYLEKNTVLSRGMRCDFQTSVSPNRQRDFVLVFYVCMDRENKQCTLKYRQFYEVVSDEDADRMEELGLDRFVKK